jgi:RING finger and CHY zinc finger domain-containing protein 1
VTRANPKQIFRSSSLPSNFKNRTSEIPEDNHHQIDRHAVVEVICRYCYTRQSSKTNHCVSCNVQFGEYHCLECNLWMSAEEHPYHCSDCGFCRIGGTENFQHCHDCGMCIDRTLFATHHCRAERYRTDCPVCQEYLFNSRRASHEMPCGHAIHWHCFRELAEHDLRCPLCKKTAESMERMAPTWEATAVSIEMQPIPRHLARVVNIMCIDCERTDTDREWHFLGTQCRYCTSFNTLVDQIVMQGDKAYDFLKQKVKHGAHPPLRQKSSRRNTLF